MDIISIGLLYDGAGVFILGIYTFFKPIHEYWAEGHLFWGGNKSTSIESIYRRLDTGCGSLLLLTGFTLQFIGKMNWINLEGLSLLTIILFVLLILFVLSYMVYFREYEKGKYMAKIDDYNKQQEAKQK